MGTWRAALLVTVAWVGLPPTPTAVFGPGEARAQATPVRTFAFDIGPRPLAQALNDFARVTGQSVVFTQAEAAAAQSPGVRGTMGADAALAAITAGTGWTWQRSNANTVTLAQAQGAVTLPEVRVQAGLIPPQATIGPPPPPFAGGQVASGARIGALGNRGIFDTPFNVVPFTRELAENQQARSMSDVLRNDPSIQLGQGVNGLGTDDVLNIRGFLLGSFATLYDGLPGLNFRSPAIELVERVEVFRGPTALVSGSAGGQGIGGMVNLVPKRAPDAPITNLTTRYVSDSTFGVHADFARRFGPDGAFGVRINAVRRAGELAGLGSRRETTVLGLATDWRGDRARITFDIDYQNDENARIGNSLLIAPGVPLPRVPSNQTYFWQPWTFLDQEKVRMVLRGEYDIAPDWTISLAYGRRSVEERFNDTIPTIIDAAGTTRLTSTNGASRSLGQVLDAAVRGVAVTGPVRHRIAFGATQTQFDSAGRFVAGPTFISSIYSPIAYPRPQNFEPTPSVPGRSSVSITRSVFVSDELSILDDRVFLTLGLRNVEIYNRGFDDITGNETSRYRERALTPAVGLVVKPLQYLSLYANYQQGLEPGGQAPLTARNAGELLAPFVADAYEAGIRLDLGNVGFTLGAFEITRDNAFVDPVTSLFGANGRQVNKGIEFLTFGQPWQGVRLVGGVTLLDATAERTQGGQFDGNRPIGQPEWTVRAYAEWDTPFAQGLTLTGGLAYASGQYLDAANTQRIPAWTRFDLGARYAFQVQGTPMTARFAVENVADTSYWASVDRGNFWVSTPRTYLFSLTASF